MTARRGNDKPHITWSKFWDAWMASERGVHRIGPTPLAAFNTLKAALLSGNVRSLRR